MRGVTILEMMVVITILLISAAAVVLSTNSAISGIEKTQTLSKITSSVFKAKSYARNSGSPIVLKKTSVSDCILSYQIFVDNYPFSTNLSSEDKLLEQVCEKSPQISLLVNESSSDFFIINSASKFVTNTGVLTTSNKINIPVTDTTNITVSFPQYGQFTCRYPGTTSEVTCQ